MIEPDKLDIFSAVNQESSQPVIDTASLSAPQSMRSPESREKSSGRDFFEAIFSTKPDPWQYTRPYEQTKYEQTLSLLPSTAINKALELGCAEGHFTVQLAPRIGSLMAADFAQTALERAKSRCQHLKNICFQNLDITTDRLAGHFDLIVCSEMLYCLGSVAKFDISASKITKALEPGGYLLMANAHLIVDELEQTGYTWDRPFGGKFISDQFTSIPDLRLLKEIWTPLYRVQLFQRCPKEGFPQSPHTPEKIKLNQQPTPLSPHQKSRIRWRDQPQALEDKIVIQQLPILMYHRVAPTGCPAMSLYRVTPEQFEEQLQYLRDAGFSSVSWDNWQEAMLNQRPLGNKSVAITFDDGYLDFFQYAWPLLKKYGFTATVFLVTNCIGGSNVWAAASGEELPLLGWDEIRQLQKEGVEFGSHAANHQRLTTLSAAEVIQEGTISKTILESELGVPIKIFAYPYGDFDSVVQNLIRNCGYTLGLSCRFRTSQLQDNLLALPRIVVNGSDTIQDFRLKLN